MGSRECEFAQWPAGRSRMRRVAIHHTDPIFHFVAARTRIIPDDVIRRMIDPYLRQPLPTYEGN